MPLATRNGVTLHLQALGEAGPPVVMLHGLLVGSLATWYFTAAPALAKTHRVLMYDLRGHGKSERTAAGYDVATMAADLAAVVDAFTDEPVTLIGHSFGAVVALSYALARPERVAKLAVIEAPLPPSQVGEMDGFLGRSPESMADALPEALREAVVRGGRQAVRFLDGLKFLAFESSLFADLKQAEDIGDDALRALACPTLAVYGASSSCRPVGDRIARHAPNARLLELPGGHFLPLDAAAPLASALTEFVHG
jgi:pimeloyl-ACP methyl ester carboxylesterase